MNCRNARRNLVDRDLHGVALNYGRVPRDIPESIEPETCHHRAGRGGAGRYRACRRSSGGVRTSPALSRVSPLWSGIPEEPQHPETRGSITTKSSENGLKSANEDRDTGRDITQFARGSITFRGGVGGGG